MFLSPSSKNKRKFLYFLMYVRKMELSGSNIEKASNIFSKRKENLEKKDPYISGNITFLYFRGQIVFYISGSNFLSSKK